MNKGYGEWRIKVEWTYIDKPPPQFAKLMSLLLLKSINNLSTQTKREGRDNEHKL